MILSYRIASNNRELDRITITRDSVSYKTGVAEEMVQNKILKYGYRGTMTMLESWSNGYVSTSRISD